jgi:hypothetical protein
MHNSLWENYIEVFCMKRTITILINIIVVITFCSCNMLKSNPNVKKNIFGVFKAEEINNNRVHLLLYFPDGNGKYLIPEDRLVGVDKYIEETIAKEVMKGPNSGNSKWQFSLVKVLSVSGKNNILTLNLSKNFKNILLSRNINAIEIYSIVNSLTELPGLNGVLFVCEGAKLSKIKGIDFSVPIGRDRRFFNRDKHLLPNEVLKRQMTLEKNGHWLNSYLLMSDEEGNNYRKYHEAYYEEMEEMKEKGFLDTDFIIGKYKVDASGKKARVEASFISKSVDKKSTIVNKVYFNTVKIEGAWMVDWLTKQ